LASPANFCFGVTVITIRRAGSFLNVTRSPQSMRSPFPRVLTSERPSGHFLGMVEHLCYFLLADFVQAHPIAGMAGEVQLHPISVPSLAKYSLHHRKGV